MEGLRRTWILIMKVIKEAVNLILICCKIQKTNFIINKDWCKSPHRKKNGTCFNHHLFLKVFTFHNWRNLSLILWRNNFCMKLKKYLLSYLLNLKENISHSKQEFNNLNKINSNCKKFVSVFTNKMSFWQIKISVFNKN